MSHLMKSVIVSMPMNCCLSESQRGQARTPESYCNEDQPMSPVQSASDPDPLDLQYVCFLDPDPDSRGNIYQNCKKKLCSENPNLSC